MSDTRVRRVRQHDAVRDGTQPDAMPIFREEQGRAGWLGYGFGALIVVVVLGVVGGVASGRLGDSTGGTVASAEPTPGSTTPPTAEDARLYPDRPDTRPGDREVAIGQGVAFGGYTTGVDGAAFQQTLGGQFVGKGYIVTAVSILNRAPTEQPYDESHWKLQTPAGAVIDKTFATTPSLGSGTLTANERATGRVVFEVGAEKGHFYLLYAPSPGGADRGVWKVTL